jgi:nucleoside-diphosphate-sugar epimerase
MFHKLYGMPIVICRIFMTYGPHQKNRKIIPYLIRSMLSHSPPKIASGSRLVDWIFVDDTIEALILCGTMPNIEGKTIDIGSGKLVSINDVAKMLETIIPGAPSPEIGSQPPYGRARAADLSIASHYLHWSPKISLEDGLRTTIDWYRAREEWRP